MSTDPTGDGKPWGIPAPDTDRHTGLYAKYRVERLTDHSGKHDGCRYFVLDPKHDPHAVVALRAYADSARSEYPALAGDLAALAATP